VANMARPDGPGAYQIGIYHVRRQGRGWTARASGPGTLGDGFAGDFASLGAAHLALTGEPMRQTRPARHSAILRAIAAGDKPAPGDVWSVGGRRYRKTARGWRALKQEA
jgi:hypothetical protein